MRLLAHHAGEVAERYLEIEQNRTVRAHAALDQRVLDLAVLPVGEVQLVGTERAEGLAGLARAHSMSLALNHLALRSPPNADALSRGKRRGGSQQISATAIDNMYRERTSASFWSNRDNPIARTALEVYRSGSATASCCPLIRVQTLYQYTSRAVRRTCGRRSSPSGPSPPASCRGESFPECAP